MNNFFWKFDYNWDLPNVDDLFPNQYYAIRCRSVSTEVLSNEFHEKLKIAGIYITRVSANYAPAGVDVNYKKYGSIINEPEEQSRIDIVIKGQDTSSLVWWEAKDSNKVLEDNLLSVTHKALRGGDVNNFNRRLSQSFSAAVLNTTAWTSVETTTEERFWLKLYFRTIKDNCKLSFFDTKNILQSVI